MDALEYFYELDFSKLNIYGRKKSITSSKTLIYGAPRCGKSFLIYERIQKEKKSKSLYLDCGDPRVTSKEIGSHLRRFIDIKKIELLALDNYRFDFELPKCENIIISSCKKMELDGFETVHAAPLDFEEYIEFEKKFTNITNSFSLYLKDGSLPEIPFLHDALKIGRIQELARLMSNDKTEFEVYKLLAAAISRKVTTYQLFNELKKTSKISKDRFYSLMCDLVEKSIIYLVEKAEQPNGPKKLYFYDFAFKNALSLEKDFAALFENMIFTELQSTATPLYYDDYVEFLMPNCAVFKLPFGQKEHIIGKLDKALETLKKCGIKESIFVTLGFEGSGEYGGVRYEATPFWEWAVMT